MNDQGIIFVSIGFESPMIIIIIVYIYDIVSIPIIGRHNEIYAYIIIINVKMPHRKSVFYK